MNMRDYRESKNMSMREVHDSLLKMLKVIDSVCKDNGITYFLSGGTAIGAIREKGFIPWDDDIDIMLPRNDYEKLISVLEQDNKGRYRMYSLHDSSWNRPYSCIVDGNTIAKHELVDYSHLGVTMDILPIDGLSSSPQKVRNYYKRLRFIYSLYYSSLKINFSPGEKLIPLKKFVSIFTKMVGAHRICEYIDNKARTYEYEASEFVGCSVLIHFMEKECFKKEWFREQIYVPFEGEKFPIMNGYDEYLKSLYGNYMKRPEQERNPDHHTSYYWK